MFEKLIDLTAGLILALYPQVNEPKYVEPTGIQPTEFAFKELYLTKETKFPEGTGGFCFPWSVAVLNRFDGKAKGEPTKTEWRYLTQITRVDPVSGGTEAGDAILFFAERGYSTYIVEIQEKTDCQEYYYVAEKLHEGCLAEVIMTPKDPASPISGHVEAVLGIEKCEAITNSWGEKATISSKRRYRHSHMKEYNLIKTDAWFLVACPSTPETK